MEKCMIGPMLLIVGLLGAWTSDGIRDGFHVAQSAQHTWYPRTYGGIVDYGNYHDFVAVEQLSVAMAGTGAFIWSRQNPEWWRVAGVTVGASMVGWMAREWLIDYVPTGQPMLRSQPWHSTIFGNVPDRGGTFQIGVGLAGAGLAAAALLVPHGELSDFSLEVHPLPGGVQMAVNF
jgi:hypothetical protein